MGWLLTHGQTRRGLIQALTHPHTHADGTTIQTLTYSLRGQVLWSVREMRSTDGTTERWIGCDLLSSHSDYGWGYKALEESMGPVHVSCPLLYLSLVPEPDREPHTGWRKAVRAYHTRMRQPLKKGQVVQLVPGCTPQSLIIESLRPLRGRHHDIVYRINRRHLAPPAQQVALS